VGEESLSLQSKPHLVATFPPLAEPQILGRVLGMRDNDDTPDDDDFTPDDGGDHESDHDHDRADGSFDEEQSAWDKAEQDAQDARRGSCLLVLLAVPAASLLAILW
jgi:hypothetical protein